MLEVCHTVGRFLLGRLVEVCQEHDLSFHLGGGTLLGACRDGKFIAWDDDIDISMPRASFDRLCELAATHPDLFGPEIGFDSGASTTEIGRIFLLDSGGVAGPVRIDVLVIDPVPSRKWAQRLVARTAWVSRIGVTLATTPSGESGQLGSIARLIVRIVGEKRVRWMYRHAVDAGVRFGDGHTSNCLNGSRPMGRERPTAWYQGDRREQFEGLLLPVPEQAESILTMIYGPDWKTPPPMDQQHPLHFRPPMWAQLGDQRWDVS